MERMNEEGRMKFQFVTGTCKNCGGNKFKFDPKEQTFVCEYCQTEVYAVSPLPEQEKGTDNKESIEDRVGVEPIKEEKADDNNVSGANVEPKEEESVYSGYSGSDSFTSAIYSLIAGTLMILLRPILCGTGIIEKVLANGEASLESANSNGVAPEMIQTAKVMEAMVKGIGSDSFLTFTAVFGLVMIMMGMVKLIKSLMWSC